MHPKEITKTAEQPFGDPLIGGFRALFESELDSGRESTIESWLIRVPETQRSALFGELLNAEVSFLRKKGSHIDRHRYRERFPQFSSQIDAVFEGSDIRLSISSFKLSMASTLSPTRKASPDDDYQKLHWFEGDYVGRYRLDALVGRGGFGEVWKGFDPELKRVVAVKVPRPGISGGSDVSQEFLEEAQRAALLKHEGIVPVYDVGRVEAGCFIVSEFIDGPTLAQYIQSKTIPRDEAVEIVRSLALTLHNAHLSGLIHRDIKPSNILMRKDGTLTITDFGLAVSEEEQLNLEPGIAGTYAYMSPEQARGEARLLDGRSDLYSLGVILFQLLTGRMPFQYRTTKELLEQIQYREVRSLRSIDDSIPPSLDAICLKCLAKHVRNRYATGRDLANDLANCGRPKRTGINRILAVSGVVLAIVVLAGVLLNLGIHRFGALDANHVVSTPPAAKPNPAVAVDVPPKEWTAMLDCPLKPIVSQRSFETDFLHQSPSTNSLVARSERAFWIHASELRGNPPMRIRGSVFMEDWVGSIGFVWGLSDSQNEFPPKPPSCFAILIERFFENDPLGIYLCYFETNYPVPDLLSIKHRTTIAWEPISVPKTPYLPLELVIDAKAVTVLIDGVVAWEPVIYEERMSEHLTNVNGNVGVMLRGKSLSMQNVSVWFLNSTPNQERIP